MFYNLRIYKKCKNLGSGLPARGPFGFDYLIDGVSHPTVVINNVPEGYASVDVSIIDRVGEVERKMVTGHFAAAASAAPTFPVSSSPGASSLQLQPESMGQGLYDNLSPMPQGFLCAKA